MTTKHDNQRLHAAASSGESRWRRSGGVLGRRSARPRRSAAAIDSRIRGVQVGAITYSFRALTDAHAIVKAMAPIGLGEVELMSNHAEALAGAPTGAALPTRCDAWRRSHVSRQTWAAGAPRLRRRRDPAPLLCYNMNVKTTRTKTSSTASRWRERLGVKAITTSTQVSMAKRVAPFADKHRIWSAITATPTSADPDEVATPESFADVSVVLEVPRASTSTSATSPRRVSTRSRFSGRTTRASRTCT